MTPTKDSPTTPEPRRPARIDPRVLRTRAALIDAMTQLIWEAEEGAVITMSAVALRAGLSRQVLHNHYRDVGALMMDVIYHRLLEGVRPAGSPVMDNGEQELVAVVAERGIEPFLARMHEDRLFFRKLRSLPRTDRFALVLAAAFSSWMRHGAFTETSSIPFSSTDDGVVFTMGGMIALATSWQESASPPPASEQARRLESFARSVAFVRPGWPSREEDEEGGTDDRVQPGPRGHCRAGATRM
ncbi:hypothetical protein C5C59_11840 [Rathayibacter sp. AY1F4]|nr:hypothetical protein C5C26_05325 [Rathayibacter sp. AY2B1]PPG69074.1 hypothetical protein C5C59_11840 [Rathayibacter sp. AY1F4]